MRRQYEGVELDVNIFQADKDKVKKHPAFVESGLAFEGRPNIIGVLEGNGYQKPLILNGHVDIVSPEPVDQWRHAPWGAEMEGNRLYGRGLEVSSAAAGPDNRKNIFE